MIEFLIALISLISYLAELRRSVAISFGIYFSGLLDGIIATILVASAMFYIDSKASQHI